MEIRLKAPEVQEAVCDPHKTALVVIDLENEFCAPGGLKYVGKEAGEAVQATAALVNRVRAAGGRVLWVRSVRDPDALEFTAFKRDPFLLRGSWGVEFSEPLHVLEGEPVIEKHSHDCFNHTGMDACLEENGIIPPEWSILVTGTSLHVCVHCAVSGFSVRNYRVFIPLDCVAPRTGEAVATLWHYGLSAYSYNVTVTESARIRWAGKAGSTGGVDGAGAAGREIAS